MKNLLIATSNPGKLREVRAMLAALSVQVICLKEIDPIEEPIEDGDTFDANARKKATYYAAASGLWALADDSGLEVDAIGGAPGIYSARYAGPDATDRANNTKLIRELRDTPAADRTARFRCAMALATPAKVVVATSSGAIEGVIVDEPRGQNGFGYDPHFFIPSQQMTAAELSKEQKNRISHRGRALAAIHPKIVELLSS